jgi:N-acetylneuraminate synthase
VAVKIIAEIGINHNGDINVCKQLIDLASEVKCDAVKFQKRDVNLVYSKALLDSPRESPWGQTQRAQKEGLEFNQSEYEEIADYCNTKNIDWFASAWDTNSQKFLRKFDCKYNKIASAMIVHTALLKLVAEEQKPTFVSTGMAQYTDIDNAVEIFQKAGCPFELMHTVSTYPMKDEHANLRLIEKLRDRYRCDVGYSGHETGVAISLAAATLGATSIERHITIDRTMYGSDQAASLEPAGLRQLVGSIRKIEQAFGDGVKKILDDEVPIAEKLRENLV